MSSWDYITRPINDQMHLSSIQIKGFLTSWTQPEKEHAKLEAVNAELAAIQKELSTVSIMVWMIGFVLCKQCAHCGLTT